MANIMLIDSCNLRCTYCFANEFVNLQRNEISYEAFVEAVDFILGDKSESIVGIIGGEPTLHSDFDHLMRIVLSDERTKGVMLYTNGILIDRYWDVCCHAKTHLLVNCNSPDDIGREQFDRLCSNLDVLLKQKMCNDRVTLGINMYKPDFEYGYLIDLLKKYAFHHVRVSVTVPNLCSTRNTNAHDWFIRMKPSVLCFFSELMQNDIIPNFDCNKIPSCLFTEEDIKAFNQLMSRKFVKDNIGNSNLVKKSVVCTPVVDIRQDLTAVRCFGLSEWTKQSIRDFKGIRDLKNYYLHTVDTFACHTVYSSRCIECYERKVLSCYGGCLAFKSKQIREAKKHFDEMLRKDHIE